MSQAEQEAEFAAAEAAAEAERAAALEAERSKNEKSWPKGVHLEPEQPKKPKRRISWSDAVAAPLPLERVAPAHYYSESEGEEDDADGSITFTAGKTGDDDEEDEEELSTPAPTARPKRAVAPSLDVKGPKMEITERQDALPQDDPSLVFSTMYGDDTGGGGGGGGGMGALMF